MIILEKCTVLQFDPPGVQEGIDIVIEEGSIVDAGEGVGYSYANPPHIGQQSKVTKTVDCTGKFVMPGLVCSHNHFYSGLSRGILAPIKESVDFVSQLQNLWWRLDTALDRDSLYSSAVICALDAVKAGTTAVVDHHSSQTFIDGSLDVVREAFRFAGLRGATCFETTDRNSREGMEEGVAENQRFALDCIKKEDPLMRGLIGGHAPFTLNDGALKLLAGAVEKSGCGLHLHVGEDRYDGSHSHSEYGMDMLERLDSFGLLEKPAVIAHGTYLTDKDIDLANRKGAFLVHNGRSNMNNNVGYNYNLGRVEKTALGTDGIGSNMFEEMKVAYFKHKDAGGSLWPGDFLGFLNEGNQLLETLFVRKFGKIEEGYTADLVIYNYDSPTPLTGDNIAGHMVFGMNSSSVESVIINGEFVLDEGQFPQDVDQVYREASKQAEKLWDRM